MSYEKFITDFLNIKPSDLSKISTSTGSDGSVFIRIRLSKKSVLCPFCNRKPRDMSPHASRGWKEALPMRGIQAKEKAQNDFVRRLPCVKGAVIEDDWGIVGCKKRKIKQFCIKYGRGDIRARCRRTRGRCRRILLPVRCWRHCPLCNGKQDARTLPFQTPPL